MGMDVYGRRPTSDRGRYFRASVWSWRPLWEYCHDLAPDIIGADLYTRGHANEGAGLPARGARQLAARLKEELASGRVAEYEREFEEARQRVPKEPCEYCGGTGNRPDLGPPEWKEACGGCNVCRGTGLATPTVVYYTFEEDLVREFAEFLEDSGGFEIW